MSKWPHQKAASKGRIQSIRIAPDRAIHFHLSIKKCRHVPTYYRVPVDHTEHVKEAIFSTAAGGHAAGLKWWVTERFQPDKHANPVTGEHWTLSRMKGTQY